MNEALDANAVIQGWQCGIVRGQIWGCDGGGSSSIKQVAVRLIKIFQGIANRPQSYGSDRSPVEVLVMRCPKHVLHTSHRKGRSRADTP